MELERKLWCITYCGGDYYDYPEEIAYFDNQVAANTALSEIHKYVYNRFIVTEAEKEIKAALDKSNYYKTYLTQHQFEEFQKKYGFDNVRDAHDNVLRYYDLIKAYAVWENQFDTDVKAFVEEQIERINVGGVRGR